MLPRPIQRPHPPLYMASTKPDTVVHSAELGVGALIFGFAGIDSVEHQHKLYTDAHRDAESGEKLVSTVSNDQFVALCPTIVLDDAQQAREMGARGQRFFGDSIGYWHLGMGDAAHPRHRRRRQHRLHDDRQAQERAAAFDRGDLPQYAERSLAYANFNIDHAYGSVDTAIQYVTELERVGVDEVLCLIQMGTVSQDVCMETIRHWGEQVIPHFRAKAHARAAVVLMARLAGKVAIITGAAPAGTARPRPVPSCTKARGSSSPTLSRKPARALADELGPGPPSSSVLDVSSADAWDGGVQAVIERHGRLDVLVNNAARYWTRPLLEETPTSWTPSSR